MNNYKLEIYDTAGTKKYLTDDFAKLGFVRRVNSPGLVQVQLSGANPILSNIADFWQIEVWRQPEGYAWAREQTGIFRKGDWVQPVIPSADLTAKGLLSILGWRVVAYYAGESNHSVFIAKPAETIANTIASENCTAAGAATRIRNGTIAGLSVEANGGDGANRDWYCAYDNVLTTLQNLALLGDGDFDVVKLTPTTWEYRWYVGQLGTDRSTTVAFSMGLGNMANPQIRRRWNGRGKRGCRRRAG